MRPVLRLVTGDINNRFYRQIIEVSEQQSVSVFFIDVHSECKGCFVAI